MKDKRLLLTPRVLCAAFVFALIALLAPATTSADGPSQGGFLYTVQYGDTLSTIAARFGVSVQSIVQANGAARSYMYVGQRMYMPSGYSPNNYGSASTYMVQPGDTLYGIAQRYGVSMYTLMRMNRFYNPNYIYSGMRMQLPYKSYAAASYQSYVIRMGDTLSGIALQFGTSIYALMIANNIPNPNLIFAGMRLAVPNTPAYSTTRTDQSAQFYQPSPRSASPTQMAVMPAPTTAPPTPTSGPSATRTAPPTPTSAPSATTTAPIVNGTVSMKNIAFNPRAITVHVGAKVVWTNNETDGMPHTATSGTPGVPSGLFDSGTLNPGQSFQFTFNSVGTFPYYCRIHGAMMTGTITVVP